MIIKFKKEDRVTVCYNIDEIHSDGWEYTEGCRCVACYFYGKGYFNSMYNFNKFLFDKKNKELILDMLKSNELDKLPLVIIKDNK
jgi:hypothetical protein